MSVETELKELRATVRYMKDRQDILDCITRNSRGNDRFDTDLVASSYHPDGVAEVGANTIQGQKYGEHANHAHAAMSDQNMHHVTMHSCDVQGDEAHAESYVIGMFLDKGGESSRILSGRYLDRLEKRNSSWRIVNRRATVEVVLEGTAKMMEAIRKGHYLKGGRDIDDLTYVRPLGMDEGARW